MDGFTSTWMRDVEQQLRRRKSSPCSTKKLVDGACTDPSSPEKQGIGIEVDGELVVDGGEDESGGRELTCVSHGSISVMGRRRAMEDAVTVTVVPASAEPCESGSYDFFAVYDGHGGSNVADLCRDRLHELLSSEMEACGGRGGAEIDWNKVMAACFEKMDEEVGRIGCRQEDGADSETMVGSTAVVVVVGMEEIVVANCGDSRAVLCRGGGVAVPLSRDHKPDRPDERERVEAAGGRVLNWRGSRVLGVLATSRSIGDHYLKPYVTSEPEVTVRKRADSDNFLVIASDGLWDVVSNEMACLVVSRCLDGRISWSSDKEPGTSTAGMAAEVLAKLAMARDSKDNISVIVVELRKPGYDNSSST